MGVLRSVHNSSSLLLIPPYTFLLLQRVSSMGCSSSGNIHPLQHGVIFVFSNLVQISAPAWSSPQPAMESLLWHLEQLLPFLSLSPWCLHDCFSPIFFSVLSLNCHTAGFLPSPKHIFPEMPTLWLTGSTVSCSGSTGVGWNWLCLAQGSLLPLLFSTAPQMAKSCHLHPAKTCIMELYNYSEYLD